MEGTTYLVRLVDTVDTDGVVAGEAVELVVAPVLDVSGPERQSGESGYLRWSQIHADAGSLMP